MVKGISSHNIYSGNRSQQINKNNCHSLPKTFDFSQNSSIPFHQVTFDHSISCVFLIDNQKKAAKTAKNLKEMPYPPQKRALKKKRK